MLRSRAHTDAEIVSAQGGELRATIELLRPDCSVVGSWRDQSGGMITIDPAGSTSFGPIPEEEPGLPSMDEVAACGNTQFSAGSASPAVAGRGPVPRPASTSPGTISRPMPLVRSDRRDQARLEDRPWPGHAPLVGLTSDQAKGILMTAIIETEKLANRAWSHRGIDDVDPAIETGEILGVLGPAARPSS